MAAFTRIEKGMRWYVMRDLKRANAKVPAYKLLEEMKMEVFVPMKWHLVTRKGMRIREEVPFIQDLLFVHETQNNLDAVVEKIPTLQYRWLRGTWREPMTVADTRTWNVSSVPWMPLNPPGITCRKKLPQPCTGVRSALRADRSADTREGCSRHGAPRSNACLSNWKDFLP